MTEPGSSPQARRIRPLAAAAFMLGACFCFSFNSVFVRFAAEDVHPFEVAFFRNLFGLMFVLMIALPKDGPAVFRCVRPGTLLLRGGVNTIAMLAWFYSVPLLPLADLTALGFTAPLWATVLAALLLGETVRLRRWSATIVGFAGAMVVIQPGLQEVHYATYLILFSSACWGLTVIIVRHMTAYERPNTILVYQTLLMSLFSLFPALFVWSWPSWTTVGHMLVLGALSASAHWCHVRAYAMQEVAALQPLDYARLPIIVVAAWYIFGEAAGPQVWLGATIIFGAGLFISFREAQLRREARSAGSP